MSQVLADTLFTSEADMSKTVLTTFNGDYSLTDIQQGMFDFVSLLAREGDLKGKKVALLVPHIPKFLQLVLAINKLGGIVIPLSAQLRRSDMRGLLDLLNPHIVLTVKEHNDYPFLEIISDWSSQANKNIVVYASEDGSQWELRNEYKGEVIPLETEPMDIIACSSGSTGVPKGIVFGSNYLVDGYYMVADQIQLQREDCVFENINPSVIYGLLWLYIGLKQQCHLVTPEYFDVPRVVQMLKKHQPNKLSTTPSLLRAIYYYAKSMNMLEGFERLERGILSGELIPEDLLNSLQELQHCRFEGLFGSSESNAAMFTSNDIRESMEWEVFDGVQYKLVESELYFKGQHIFKGYYNRPDLTQEILTEDGWYITGDLATINQRGKIEILGRKKHLIKKGGQSIIPGEIEHLLVEHPSVDHAVLVGIPHKTLGEQVVAFIVANEKVNSAELKFYCAEHIAAYKVPDRFVFIEEIPMINGKADRLALKNMVNS